MDNLAALIIGPSIAAAVTIVGVIVNVIISKRNTRTADSAVGVQQQQADTTEFSAIVEGFKLSLAETRQSLNDVRTKATEDRERSAEDIRKLSQRIDAQNRREDSILAHMTVIENLIPFPPGPPQRPVWIR